MPKYQKKKVDLNLYIQQGEFKEVISNLTDPSPTIFETIEGTEVRFNVLIEDQDSFLKYHALDKYQDKDITVGISYDETGVELKSTFLVNSYERRFGSDKGAIVTHVLKGSKNG